MGEQQREILIYTDGACSTNGTWKGGWAFVAATDQEVLEQQSGNATNTTNNIMEMQAVKSALLYVNTIIKPTDHIYIMSDSAYIVNCIRDGWYKKWRVNGWVTSQKAIVQNKELWKDIISLYEDLDKKYHIEFIKVKGHSGDKYNTMADKLATEASK